MNFIIKALTTEKLSLVSELGIDELEQKIIDVCNSDPFDNHTALLNGAIKGDGIYVFEPKFNDFSTGGGLNATVKCKLQRHLFHLICWLFCLLFFFYL